MSTAHQGSHRDSGARINRAASGCSACPDGAVCIRRSSSPAQHSSGSALCPRVLASPVPCADALWHTASGLPRRRGCAASVTALVDDVGQETRWSRVPQVVCRMPAAPATAAAGCRIQHSLLAPRRSARCTHWSPGWHTRLGSAACPARQITRMQHLMTPFPSTCELPPKARSAQRAVRLTRAQAFTRGEEAVHIQVDDGARPSRPRGLGRRSARRRARQHRLHPEREFKRYRERDRRVGEGQTQGRDRA